MGSAAARSRGRQALLAVVCSVTIGQLLVRLLVLGGWTSPRLPAARDLAMDRTLRSAQSCTREIADAKSGSNCSTAADAKEAKRLGDTDHGGCELAPAASSTPPSSARAAKTNPARRTPRRSGNESNRSSGPPNTSSSSKKRGAHPRRPQSTRHPTLPHTLRRQGRQPPTRLTMPKPHSLPRPKAVEHSSRTL